MTDNKLIDVILNNASDEERKIKIFDNGLMKEFEIIDISETDEMLLLWIDTRGQKWLK